MGTAAGVGVDLPFGVAVVVAMVRLIGCAGRIPVPKIERKVREFKENGG